MVWADLLRTVARGERFYFFTGIYGFPGILCKIVKFLENPHDFMNSTILRAKGAPGGPRGEGAPPGDGKAWILL